MEQILILILACIMMGGCTSTSVQHNLDASKEPPVTFESGVQQKLEEIHLLDAPVMTIAV